MYENDKCLKVLKIFAFTVIIVHRLSGPAHVGSPTRDQTHLRCVDRQILYH